MEIRGIDVSAWQGAIDWDTVANYGMDFAILRITEAGNVIDSCFEKNYSGCQKHNIPTGAYKYSYAMTVAEIQSEARKVVEVLNGRKLQYPVWLDLEWNNQRSLGAEQIHKLAEAFEKIITAAGYKFGIYCNVDWYLNVICSHLKKYDFWIACYPESDNGTLQERLRPDFGVGWQYSSKAKIPGISGTVDRNVFYKDYAESKKQEGGTDVDKEIEKVILIAKNEEGYLEKKSNNQLDNKTANAGSANYTKYWRDIKPDYQGQPWCAAFISWCFMKAFGLDNAKKLLKHWPYVYCPTLGKLFARNANPKIGDVVIFYHNGTFTHTGLVTAVIGDRFYTIEGNTSGASGIIANGGGVCAKSYLNSQMPGTKFCTPDYSIVSNAVNKPSDINKIPSNTIQTGEKYMFNPETVKAGDKNTSVLLLQEILRARGFKGKNGKALKLTWTADANTIYALKAYQESRKEVLEVDGICGSETWKDLIAI
ncbi:GH25 family lysozyme [Blautia wexlerae]|uniref:GH25 family lysozyme n=1 Tax=Blautia wexlerae TaxID=418240 RepID=UPI00325B658B